MLTNGERCDIISIVINFREELIMKSTGVVRRIDELGRIVLPIEIRRSLDINVKDPVEIFIDNERIILQKYSPSCIFCGDADNIVFFNGKRICAKCLEEIKNKL